MVWMVENMDGFDESYARLSFCRRRDGYIYFKIGKAADFKGTLAAFKMAVPAAARRFDGAEKMWRVDEAYAPVLEGLFLNYPDVLRRQAWQDPWWDKRSMFGWRRYRMRDAVQETGEGLWSREGCFQIFFVIGLVGLIMFIFGW